MNACTLGPGRAALTLAFVLSLLAARPAHADSITLMWDPNAESVTGYAVYVVEQSGSPSQRHDVGNTTIFTMPTAVAGQQYCFAVSAYIDPGVEGPRSSEVCGYSNQFPVLTEPANQTSVVGQSDSLQLSGSDPDGQPVSYSASGLPPGLTLMSTSGFISGAATAAGTYAVTASVSDGVLSSLSQSFTWTVSSAPASDTTLPSVAITGPTSASTYATSASTIALSGTSSDNVGVSAVTWASDRGGSGTATGTTAWNVPSIGLHVGTNVITATARDTTGNVRSDSVAVTYTPPDTTVPAISIVTPTTSSAYTTTAASLSISGSASDNVGVTQVSWVNDRGGSGTATGTTSWSISFIGLRSGTNVITVTARDAAANQKTDVLTVTFSAPDTTAPTISILGPTSASTYTTTSSVVTLGGSSSDDRGVTAVTWSNDRGGSGFSSGTTSWSVPSVALQSGTNVITVKAQDAAGNQGTDVLTVTWSPPAPVPAPSIVLSGSVYSSRKWTRVLLRWTLVSGRSVDVYRNDARITKTGNDGSYIDAPRGAGPFSYRVCISGTTTCSNTIVLTK